MVCDMAGEGVAAFRARFPKDEAREAWLPWLLEAYATLDAGVARTVYRSERSPACRAGCCYCCRQPIPASSLEVLGLCWYVTHHASRRTRNAVLENVRSADRISCPFLVETRCAAYPLRPLACREFVMLGPACRPGEQPTITRPADLLPLPRESQMRAFGAMLPYYHCTDATQRRTALRQRRVLRDTGVLQDRNWSGLAAILAVGA